MGDVDSRGVHAAVTVLGQGMDDLADIGSEAARARVLAAVRAVEGTPASDDPARTAALQLCEVLLAAHDHAAAASRAQRRAEELRAVVATVVEAALVEPDVELVLGAAMTALRDGMQCQGVSIRAFDEPESPFMRRFSAVHPPGAEELATDELLDISGRAARVCWVRQTASLMHADRPDVEPLTTPAERDYMLGFMHSVGAREMLMAPLGAGRQCHGWIALTRTGIHPAFDDDDVSAVMAVGREIGSVVAHARSFLRQQELIARLRELNDHKSRFTATLAHQLRNPLTSIHLHVEELVENALPAGDTDGLVSGLGAVGRAARRMHGITDSLLDLARLQESARPVLAEPVDLSVLVDECVADHEEVARAGGITVDRSGVERVAAVHGERDELEMVLDNIVANAVKYSTPGCTVRLALTREDGWVRFTCEDDGIGMDEDDVAHLFTPFHRAAGAVGRGIPGTGLGMSIVLAAVERHGGHVRARSRLGGGTRFTVMIPVGAPDQATTG
jgi:signal transduction histidine kinase